MSVMDMSAAPTRVLLVHANPFQRVLPVPPYGLERIRAAAEAVGAQVELVDPYVTEEDPVAAAVAAVRAFEPHVVGLGIRVVDDCIVVDTLEDEDPRGHDVTFFLPEVKRLRDALGEAAPGAVFVAGGAGFSGMPNECLEFLEVPYGVVGAGEGAFRTLVQRVGRGLPLDGVPGLVRRRDTGALGAYALVPGLPVRRSPLHAAINSI